MLRDDDDIYDEQQREEQLEEDEITAAEAGFVEGYEKLRFVKCKQCNKSIDIGKAFEVELKGNDYLFCSENCAERFERKQKKKKY